jgi:hypothetical protein
MSDTPAVPRPESPVEGAVTPVVPATTATASAVSPTMFRIAGGLIALAGVLHAVSYFAPSLGLAVLAGILQGLSLIGAFVVFLRAGFPHRGTIPRMLAIALIAVYAVSAASLFAVMSPAFLVITGIIGFVTLVLGVIFGVVTMRTAGIAPQISRLPIGLYLLLLVSGQAGSRLGMEWAGVLPALVYLLVGILFIAFAHRGTPAPTSTVPAPPVG